MAPRTILAAALAAALSAAPLHAQPRWLAPDDGRTIWLEALRPGMEDMGGLTTIWRAGTRLPLSDRLSMIVEVPWAHADLELDPSDDTTTTGIGNPYVGLDLASGDCGRLGFGARVPLASDDNVGVFAGFLGDFVDQAESFAPDHVPVTFEVSRACPAGESGWSLRVHGAASAWLPRGDGDSEIMALYGIQGWYERSLVLGAGLTGRALLTDEGDFAERTVHQLGGVVGFDLGAARPQIEVRVPLDEEIRDEVPWTVGLGLVVRR